MLFSRFNVINNGLTKKDKLSSFFHEYLLMINKSKGLYFRLDGESAWQGGVGRGALGSGGAGKP